MHLTTLTVGYRCHAAPRGDRRFKRRNAEFRVLTPASAPCACTSRSWRHRDVRAVGDPYPVRPIDRDMAPQTRGTPRARDTSGLCSLAAKRSDSHARRSACTPRWPSPLSRRRSIRPGGDGVPPKRLIEPAHEQEIGLKAAAGIRCRPSHPVTRAATPCVSAADFSLDTRINRPIR